MFNKVFLVKLRHTHYTVATKIKPNLILKIINYESLYIVQKLNILINK